MTKSSRRRVKRPGTARGHAETRATAPGGFGPKTAGMERETFQKNALAGAGTAHKGEAPREDAQPKGAVSGRLGRILDRILDGLAQIETGAPADRALQQVYKRSRDLGSHDRAQVGDAVYGILRRRPALDDVLARAAKAERRRIDVLDAPIQHRLRVLAWLAEQGASLEELEGTDAYAFKRIPGLFERILSGRLPISKRAPIDALALEVSLPSWMVKRLVTAFGEPWVRELAVVRAGRAPLTVRVNRAKATRAEIRAALEAQFGIVVTETSMAPDGLILPAGVDLRAFAPYEEGALEVQDEGSQLVAVAAGVRPGDRVLDACAGAGGKSLAMAAMMENRGRLVALDTDSRKLDELTRRAKRAGTFRIETRVGDLMTLPAELVGAFDVVLVDAPCTGTGTLRRSPDLAWRTTEIDLDRQGSLQRRLIGAARAALAPGGRLVYATCSILKEENEDIAAYARAELAGMAPSPLPAPLGQASAAVGQARFGWPGPPEGADGFFVASLVSTR